MTFDIPHDFGPLIEANMNFFLKRWLSDGNTPRATARPRKLGIEHLEDRVTPSTTILDLPDAQGPVQVGSQLAVPGGYNPTTVQNPIRPDQIVTVSTTGGALQIAVSSDRGQTWSNQSPATSFQRDPLSQATNNSLNPLTVVDQPSAAFDGNDTLYVAYIQRNAVDPSSAGTSGALVLDRFRLSAGGGVTALDNAGGTGGLAKQQVLYRWVNQDPIFNPVVGVNDLVSSYTDPATGQLVTNTATGRGVYVAWNTSATQTGFGDSQRQYIAPSIIQMAVSDDGGQSFSTPQYVTDNGFQVGSRLDGAGNLIVRNVGVDPQVYFTQRSVTNAITGGRLGVAWTGGKNTVGAAVTMSTLTTDLSTPLTTGTLANPLTIQSVNTQYTNPTPVGGPNQISGALPDGGGTLRSVTTTFEKTVDLTTTTGFTTLADLNVPISVFSQDLSLMSITLIAPDGTSINLLRARTVLDGNGAQVSSGNNSDGTRHGLPGGGVGGLGEQVYAIGNNQYYHPATGVVFDDQAARRIDDPNNLAPYILNVRPEDFQGLSQLNGKTAAQLSGTWQLVITNYKLDDASTPPITRSSLDQWDMKFVSRVNTTGFGADQPAVAGQVITTTTTTPTNIGTPTAALPTSGVQGWYSLAVDDSAGGFSPYQGRVYVAYTTGVVNDTNIALTYSDDGGQTWSFPTRVNDDSLSDGFSGGNRAQFQPTVTVDPTTGTVVVMWYDARWDASNARPATFMATSVDGGNTFSPNTFLNFTKSATDAIDRTTVKIEPVPNNLAGATTSFGDRQGLVAYGGTVVPVWTGNANTGGLGLMSAVTRIAAGPRVLQGDSGPVADDFTAASDAGAVAYNNVFSVDGTRQLNAFYVRFDRAVDPATFTPADIKLLYRDTTGAAAQDISDQVLSVTPLDSVTPLNFGVTVLGATRFLVTLAPQTRVGTYSYSVGPDISDRVRTVENRVFQAPLLTVAANIFGTANASTNIVIANQAPLNLTSAQVNVRFTDPAVAADAADMRLELVAPDGTSIDLAYQEGTGTVGTAFANTTFDDNAAQNIFFATSPFGTVRPDNGSIQSLPPINNGLRDINGNWRLRVTDLATSGVIQLVNWSITFNGVTFSPSTTTVVPGNATVSKNLVLAGESPITLGNVKVNVHFSDPTFPATPADATALQLTLTGPNGQTVILANGNGNGVALNNNTTAGVVFNDTIFDSRGGAAIGAAVSPYTTVAPIGSLFTAFGGLTDVNGTWTLTVTNLNGGGTLQLDSWSLVLQGTGPANTMDQNANGVKGEGAVVPAGKSSAAPLVLTGQPAPAGPVTVTANVQFVDPALASAAAGSLQLRLTGPNGRSVLLATGNGTGTAGTAFANAIFSDAGTPIDSTLSPFGTVAPTDTANTLASAFGGLTDVNGTWTLTVTNLSTHSVVQLKSWALTINGVAVGTAALPALDAFSNPTAAGGVPFVLPYTTDSLPLIIPGPRVVSVAPGLTADGAATYLDVTFSQDILGSSFTPAQVLELRSPLGTRVSGPFTVTANPPGTPAARANRTYRIGFPPQVLSGYYSVVLSPDIKSATGLKMDPNMNAGVELVTGRVIDPKVASTVSQQYNTNVVGVTVPAAADANTPGVATSVIPVADAFFLTQQLTTPIQVRLNITVPDTRDLTAQLIAPDGTVIQLFSNPGKALPPFANFTNTVFTDFAPDANAVANQGAPFTGTFLPQQQLSVLNGKFSAGTWTLRVTNKNTTTTATIVSWGLSLPQPVLGSGLGEPVVDNTTVGFRVFTANPNTVTSTTNWTPLGPTLNTDQGTGETTNGIVTVTAVDPTDRSGNTVYVGSANGGLWKTTNFLTLDPAGPIWIPLLDAASAKALRISSITIIPSNNNTDQSSIVLVGTGDADTRTAGVGFLRSVDGGNTFRLLDSTTNADAQTAILPVDDPGRDHLFSANASYVYKVVVDPVRQTSGEFYVYAAVGGDAAVAGLWRSTNSGRNWERLKAGECTDIVLAPNRVDVTVVNGQSVSTLRNADVAYAAFAGAGGGVFFAQDITAFAPVTLQLMTGGAGKPLFSNGLTNIAVGNGGTNPNAAPTRILLTTVEASANTDPLAVRIYQGWLYALVIGGGAPGLYVTKDFGANWTLVHIGTGGTRWNGDQTANLSNDETLAAFDYSTTVPTGLPDPKPVYNSLAADPSDPNVVYLGGSNLVQSANGIYAAGNSGIYRVDISTLNDAHAQVGADNSAGGVGPQAEGASTGGLVGGPSRIVINPRTGLTANNSAYFNRLRDPNNPFTTGSTQIIDGVQFVNNGFNAQISMFSGVAGNYRLRDIETVFDPLTRKSRLLISTDLGVFTAVDAANPLPTQGIYANAQFLSDSGHGVTVDGTTFDSIGTAISVSGNRSSNLALADVTQTGLQPSELAADVAGLYNRLLKDNGGNPLPPAQQNSRANQWIYNVTDQAYLNANGDILRSAAADYGADRWNGEVNTRAYLAYEGTGFEPWVYTGHVETDPQGSGTIYQYRPAPFALTDGAAQVNSEGDSTDIFSVTLPGFAPIGRSNGLFNIGLGDTATTGIWASTKPVDFAVNTADASGIVISAPNGGKVFRTTDQGVNWFAIGSAAQFNNSQGVALAFGGRIPSRGVNDFIYNGTAEGKIWVTSNGGGSWFDISAGLSGGAIERIIPNPRGNTYEAYALTATGVFYKADARTAAAWVNVTSNLFGITRNVFGESTVVPLLTQLSALAVDWRYAQPRLYVGGDSGVYQSIDGGMNWALYPSALTTGVTTDGGNLPTVRVTDLDLVYGNLNASGVPDQTSSRNVLVASTYGRGLFAIRLDPATVPGGAGTLGTSGPWVKTAPLTPPAVVNGLASITLNFGEAANPVKVDQSTLNPANMVILAPDGSSVPYTVTDVSALAANGIDSLANAFRLDFTPPATGTYQLLMNVNVRDTSGRQLNQNRNGANGERPQDNYVASYPITVNQAPTISPLANIGLSINTASTALPFTVGDAEPGTLTVTATSSNPTLLPNGNIVLGGSGTNRTVTVNPVVGQSGVSTVTLTVTDAGGRQTSTSFTVSVAAATIPFADDFNRADAPNLGGRWTVRGGTLEESLNAALATSSPALATLTAVSQVNSTAQATASLSSNGVNGSSGLVARFAGTAAAPTDYLGAMVQQNGVITARIVRQVGGVATTLSTSAPIPFAPQYVLRFDVFNDALKLFVNGTLVTFAYDTALTATGGTGIRLTSGNRLDDYTDDNVAPLPVALPPVPGTSATDTFTQADGTQLSRSWRDRVGNLSVTGNAVTGKATGVNLSTYNVPDTANVGAQTTVGFTAPGQAVGIALRYTGMPGTADQNMYWGSLSNLGNGQQVAAIWRNVNGTWTQLAVATVPGTGGVLRFEANGTALTLLLNNSVVVRANDATFTGAGGVGLRSNAGGSADDFSAFALGTTAALPYTDAFNAGNPGDQLASTWLTQAGGFNLSTSAAAATATGANTATLSGVSATDVVVSAEIRPQIGGLLATGVVARYTGTGDVGSPTASMYWGALNVFGSAPYTQYSAQIWKIVNGVPTFLTFNAVPINPADAVGKVLRLEVFGSSLKLYLDDVLKCFVVDTTLTAAGSVGVRVAKGAVLDNFAADVRSPVAPALPFTDDFNTTNAQGTLSTDWQERSGFFTDTAATQQAVGGSAGQVNVATLNGVNAADVTIAADFLFTVAGQSAQLVGRYNGNAAGTGDANMYLATVNTQANGDALLRILSYVNGSVTVLATDTLVGYFAGGFNTPLTGVTFNLSGTQLTLTFGAATLTATDSTFASGSVGIRTSKSVAVDNFTVTSP